MGAVVGLGDRSVAGSARLAGRSGATSRQWINLKVWSSCFQRVEIETMMSDVVMLFRCPSE